MRLQQRVLPVQVYSYPSLKLLRNLLGHTMGVGCLAVSPNDRHALNLNFASTAPDPHVVPTPRCCSRAGGQAAAHAQLLMCSTGCMCPT